jgi:hypothetical protein
MEPRREFLRLLALGFLVACLAHLKPRPALGEQFPARKPQQICSSAHLQDKVSIDDFDFRSYEDDESGQACLQVLHAGKIIFERTNDNFGSFILGQKASGAIPAIPNGTSVTGDNRPEMIVSQWTGGAHCCRLDYVFQLLPEFKLVTTLDARDSDGAHFADLDGNGQYYYLADDWTFAYWWESFAGSPVHSVVLQFVKGSRGGKFRLAMQKMAKPAPSPAEWAKALSDVNQELELEGRNMANDLPRVLWQEVLDLIYTGHSDLAWKFLEQAGPKAQQGAYPDLADFCSMLKSSPYFADLSKTMRDVPASCSAAKPKP